MNLVNFYRLINTIYGKGIPDIRLIQKLGLLAIKIGQIHALRPDFLSDDKCRELAKLYRSTDYAKGEDFKYLLKRSKIDLNNFNFIDFDPIASASIGQVHRAQLKSGEKVVIKFVKEDFKNKFIREVKSLRILSQIGLFLCPPLKGVANPIELLNFIEKMTLSELDLNQEIKGQEILKDIKSKFSDRYNLDKIGFAKIYKQFSNNHIMVSEYLIGPTLDKLIEQKQLTYEQLLDFFYISGFYLFVVGTFHGDIHPGNIILQNDQFYFLDTGYIGRVNDKLRRNLFYFFDALSQYDYKKSAEFLNKMSDVVLTDKKYTDFETEFLKLYQDFKEKTVGEISLTKKMMLT
jgi:ubiquinone biosynthesis protein